MDLTLVTAETLLMISKHFSGKLSYDLYFCLEATHSFKSRMPMFSSRQPTLSLRV
jgi:hypothetical protein